MYNYQEIAKMSIAAIRKLNAYEDGCDSVGVARETEGQLQKKGA